MIGITVAVHIPQRRFMAAHAEGSVETGVDNDANGGDGDRYGNSDGEVDAAAESEIAGVADIGAQSAAPIHGRLKR